ncbi:MAG: ABC transporter permease subunit [Bacteroidota bacterium]|jgi:ABC-type transport system involved in multi-copper enzyme maturation permease subunit
MIWTIAKREFLEYIKSMKFLIGFLTTLALIIISTFINAGDYSQRKQDYISAQEEMKSDVSYIRVYRPPEVFSTLVQGKDRKLGNRLEMTFLHLPPRTTGYMGEGASQHHRYVAGFSAIDYAFVVRIILSLMVIFLIYNAVNGEKSQGTLRLIYANSIPRHVLLLGKFVGGLTIILLVLLIGTIVSLLILIFSPAISLSSADSIRFLCIFSVSALYLTCFCTLSLFISVIVDRPSIALTILLQVWIFLSIIYPNLATVAAENWYKLPSDQEIIQQKRAAFQKYEDELARNEAEFNKQIMSGQYASGDILQKNVELKSKKAEVEHGVDLDFSRQLTRQLELAQTLSILSPAALYDQATIRYARTGMEQFEKFMDAVSRQWQEHVALEKLQAQNPEEGYKKTLSAFGFESESISRSFVATVPQIIILLLFSVIFFMLAYLSFLRKDVR